ncbi:MAG: Na+/H+ antiporter NhaA [Chloroflexota bacterium]|nr:Na+/H+ antiporter NhaA [Chloroflexota bacterium]
MSVQPQHPIRRVLYPISEFMHEEASGGIVLMLCAIAALIWANSPWADAYTSLWQTRVTIGPEGYDISKDLLHWINDGLMAVFFFVVGLEIKREVLVGELASLRQAALPIAAALGGMVVPALIYLSLNLAGEGASGWGVPMATDIAFALGVLALLGRRTPTSLKVFLTALAIVDDLGAVLVIALFYTAEVSWAALGAAAVFLAILTAINRLDVRHPVPYALLGIGLWVAFLKSGMHATIAGVLLAMMIPARTRVDTGEFVQRARELLDEFDRSGEEGANILTNAGQQAAVEELEAACEQVQTPMQRLEHSLHPWVAFGIVPLFALANAGVALGGDLGAALTEPVTLGVIAGLVLGKQVGITLFAWLVVRTGVTDLPSDISWRHVYGAGWLAGIGFTMSLFISSLAFGEGPLLNTAKVGILAASLLSGMVGWTIIRTTSRAGRSNTSGTPLAATTYERSA